MAGHSISRVISPGFTIPEIIAHPTIATARFTYIRTSFRTIRR
jgi:hypothetical protein